MTTQANNLLSQREILGGNLSEKDLSRGTLPLSHENNKGLLGFATKSHGS